MSWIYIPEEVEGFLEESSSDGKQFVQSSEMNTVKSSSSKGKKKAPSLPFRSTPRPILSRANRGDGWIAWWREYLANHFPLPEPAKPSSMKEINGKTSSGFSARWSRSTSSWRMFPAFLDSPYISDGSSDNWPRAGIVLGTKFAPQDPLEPTISAKDYGSTDGEDELFPTPTISGTRGCDFNRENREKSGGDDLATRVAKMERKVWPTPTVQDGRGTKYRGKKGERPNDLTLLGAAKVWPTPTSSIHKGVGPIGSKSQEAMLKRKHLNATVQNEEWASGSLSPLFVSFLMGWPDGWSNLSPLPKGSLQEWKEKTISGRWWIEEPDRPRLLPAKEIENRINQLKVLGNGMVPLCFVSAYLELSGQL